jgi:hypothetical protein
MTIPTLPTAEQVCERLDAIHRRAEKATQGPWDVLGGSLVRAIRGELAVTLFQSEAPIDAHRKQRVTHKVMCAAYADETNNATFIAHAREDVPFLLALITSQAAEIERLTKERERSNWFPPMDRIMQRYEGFDWSDYPDGISDGDAEQFFEADLQECWDFAEKQRARAEAAEASLAAAKAERDAMREALEWMRGRDDRNGSLPQPYREKIDAALSLDAQVKP